MASHHCPPAEVGALATAVRVADELAHALDSPGEDTDDNFTGAVPRRAAIALSEIGIDEQHHLQVLVDVEKRYEWVQGMMAG